MSSVASQSAPAPVVTRAPAADVAPHEVERSLKRGAVWALGSQVALQIIRFAGVIVLARLLTPDDYGAAALAITLAGFSVILGDLGFGTALVQAPDASQRRASTAFWCALGAGVVGSGVVALGALPTARAFDEPEVAGLVVGGGLTLFLVALGSTSNALLTRSMRFSVIQGAGVIASLLATACAVSLAAIGVGAWALVLQQIVLAGVTATVFVLAARWRPSLEFSWTVFRSLLRFAMPLTAGAFLFALQSIVTVLLVGRLVGIEELGIWSFSMAIVILPAALLSAPLARVIYAAFARMRDRPERVASVWLSGFTVLAGVVLPILFGLIAVAPDLIPVVFGAQWLAAVPVMQILCVFVMSRGLQTWNSAVMDAAGKPHIAMILNALVLLAIPPSIWLGSSFGIEGIAVAFSLASLLFGEFPSFALTTRELSLRPMFVLGHLRGIAFSAAVACVTVVFLRRALEAGGVAVEPRAAISVVAVGVVYAASMALFARATARQLLQTVRGFGPALRP